ncbi:MAG: three-Cys-motif partner protein TcmP [Thermodesulfobacteriota bacterium]
MVKKSGLKFDEIGYWSEIKLNIIKEYAAAFSKIMSAQKGFYHIYIDAFAGAGMHVSKTTGKSISGSPIRTLYIDTPFREYHFIDKNKNKVNVLKDLVGDRADVHYYVDDCNLVLLEKVFPKVRYEKFERGLCLLDPYGLHLNWKVVEAAGKCKSMEILLNFPVMDMNMNVLKHKLDTVGPAHIERMNAFWGDESWREIAYTKEMDLFGAEEERKEDIRMLTKAYQERLKKVAGFGYVPEPIAMRNTKGSIVYYLFFATQNPTGGKIVGDIFSKYRRRGMM